MRGKQMFKGKTSNIKLSPIQQQNLLSVMSEFRKTSELKVSILYLHISQQCTGKRNITGDHIYHLYDIISPQFMSIINLKRSSPITQTLNRPASQKR